MAIKAKEEAKELQNHIEELKTNVIERDTRLNHLQKRNDELSTLLEKVKVDAVAEFKASKQFTNMLDSNMLGWTPLRNSLRLTLVLSNLTSMVLLQAPSSKRVQKTSIWRTMPIPSHLRTTQILMLLPEDRL